MSDYSDGSTALAMPVARKQMSREYQAVAELQPDSADHPAPFFLPHPLFASNGSPFLGFSSALSDYSSIDELHDLAGYELPDLPLPALSASSQADSSVVDGAEGSVHSSNSSDSGDVVDLNRGSSSSSRMEEERRAKHRLIDVQRRHTETALLEQLEKLANLAPDEPVSSVAAAAEAQKGGREDSLSVPAAAAAGGTGKRTRRKRGRLTLLRSSVAKMAQLKETIASLTATCSAQAQMLEQQSAAVTALRGGRQQQQALMQQEQQRREEYRVSHQSLSSCFLRGAYGLLLIDVASGSVIDCNSLYCQWTSWPRQALLNHLLVTPHEVLLHYDEDNIARFQQMRDRHLLRYRDSRPLVQQPPLSGNWTRSRPVRQYGSSLRALLALETGRASSVREPWHCRWGDGFVYQTTMSIYVAAAEQAHEPDGRTWQRPTQIMYIMAQDDCVKVGDL